MSRPYESDAFQNSATFTVAITYTVAGGARWETARRRARKVAEKLCDAATRMAGVVEVTARVGERSQVPFDWSEPVWFRTANSGRAALSDPNRLERWVDPDRELARQALAADRAAADRRRVDDRRRRRAVGCPNALPSLLLEPTRRECSCVYCDPQPHLMLLRRSQRGEDAGRRGCICGERIVGGGTRCSRHRDTEVIALDGDPAALVLFVDELAKRATS